MPRKKARIEKIVHALGKQELAYWRSQVAYLRDWSTFSKFFSALGICDGSARLVKLSSSNIKQIGLDKMEDLKNGYQISGRGGLIILILEYPPESLERSETARKAIRKLKLDPVSVLPVFTDTKREKTFITLQVPIGKRFEYRSIPIEREEVEESILTTLYETKKGIENLDERSATDIREVVWKCAGRAPLTKNFFEDMHDSITALEEIAGKVLKDHIKNRRFAVQLMTRLMITYMIQKKGWLEKDRHYLDEYLYKKPDGQYYDKLRELFFEILNKPTEKRDRNRECPNTPYLNGGLFKETKLDREGPRKIDDEVSYGKLVDGFLSKYRYLTGEHSPDFTSVTIDPEVIGMVYENYINVTERKQKGAYYTKKYVVQFMCRLALKSYLERFLSPQKALRLACAQDTIGLNDGEKKEILKVLKEIKILDPACGSGAYLQGMMRELEGIRAALGDRTNRANLRREIILNNLRGVDIDPAAVWICKIRLWLNLIDLKKEYKKEEAREFLLPQLTFRVRTGDSLLDKWEDAELNGWGMKRQTRIFWEKHRDLLKEKRKEHELYSKEPKKSEKIENEILEIERKLFMAIMKEGRKVLEEKVKEYEELLKDYGPPLCLWDIYFQDVFKDGGFDIVIMNPPYVRQEDIGKEKIFEYVHNFKKSLQEKYGIRTEYGFDKRSDLYVYFYGRLNDLLRKEGTAVMVTSNSWLDVGYGVALQKFLLENFKIRYIFESSWERWFGSSVNTDIVVLEKASYSENKQEKGQNYVRFITFRGSLLDQMADPVDGLPKLLEKVAKTTEWEEGSIVRIYPKKQKELFEEGLA